MALLPKHGSLLTDISELQLNRRRAISEERQSSGLFQQADITVLGSPWSPRLWYMKSVQLINGLSAFHSCGAYATHRERGKSSGVQEHVCMCVCLHTGACDERSCRRLWLGPMLIEGVCTCVLVFSDFFCVFDLFIYLFGPQAADCCVRSGSDKKKTHKQHKTKKAAEKWSNLLSLTTKKSVYTSYTDYN